MYRKINFTVSFTILILYFIYPVFLSSEENLISNPGIENVIATEEAKKLISVEQHQGNILYFGLIPSTMLPREWFPYSGGGYGVWGATDEQAHSGKYSIFLLFKDFQKYQGSDIISLFLHTQQVEVEPDTEYEFSFWIKGNIPIVTIRGFLWNDKNERFFLEGSGLIKELRKDGVVIRGISLRQPVKISANEQWSHYSMLIRINGESKRLQMRIGLDDMNQPLASGNTIYIDDVQLIKKK